MKRAILFFLLLTVFIVSEVGAIIPISLQNASCSILDSQTIRVRNFYAQGYGNLLVDFKWDANGVLFYPVYAAYESSGVNRAPEIYNLLVPSTVTKNTQFCVKYSYRDADGLNDVKIHHIKMSDGTYATYQAQGSGQFSLCKFYFASTGNHWVSAYVTDSAGNKSNTLTAYVSVTSSTTGGHCYVDPYTLAVCCDYYGNGNYICDYSNTCGQPGGICINNKEATDTDEIMKKLF